MEDKVIKKMDESINRIIDEGVTNENLDYLYKLSKIKHMAKEDRSMYGNYGGRNEGYNNYGNYGRRGYDMKYRGHDHLDRIYDNYGRYEEGRERYGANEDTKRSLEYMLHSMEDFARMLRDEANSQEEVEMIRQSAQRIAQM